MLSGNRLNLFDNVLFYCWEKNLLNIKTKQWQTHATSYDFKHKSVGFMFYAFYFIYACLIYEVFTHTAYLRSNLIRSEVKKVACPFSSSKYGSCNFHSPTVSFTRSFWYREKIFWQCYGEPNIHRLILFNFLKKLFVLWCSFRQLLMIMKRIY